MALITSVGIYGFVASVRDAQGGAAVIFGFIGAIGIIGLPALVLEVLWRRSRPWVSVGQGSDGQPATTALFAPWTVVIGVAAIAAFVAAAIAIAVLAVRDANWLFGPLFAALGLWLGSYLIPVVSGRVTPGGVYLTPSGIEHRRYGTWWRVAWEDIIGAAPNEPVGILMTDGARPARGRTTPWGWRGDVKFPAGVPAGLLGIQTRYLSVDHTLLARIITNCIEQPELRQELGTRGWPHSEILRMR